jgi:hypothetical protein
MRGLSATACVYDIRRIDQGPTVTVCVVLAVLPLTSMIVRVTVYVPATVYVADAVEPVVAANVQFTPFVHPKFQFHVLTWLPPSPIEVLPLNVTTVFALALGLVGEYVNTAVAGDAPTVTA